MRSHRMQLEMNFGECETWHFLKVMGFPKVAQLRLGDERSCVANGRPDTRRDKKSSGEKSSYSGGYTMRNIRGHSDFLSI